MRSIILPLMSVRGRVKGRRVRRESGETPHCVISRGLRLRRNRRIEHKV